MEIPKWLGVKAHDVQVVSQKHGDDYSIYNADSTEAIVALPSNSIDLSVYSPPFSSLYTYTATERDMGNSKGDKEFFEHFQFIIGELLRVTKPGRVSAVHVADIPAML